jgi:hypothetical protein
MSEEAKQTLVCLECGRSVDVTPKLTLLGFQGFRCPSCNADVVYPLAQRYRTSYQIATPIIMVATLIGLWIGKPLIPGFGFVIMAFALVRDRAIVRALKAATKPRVDHD